MKDWNWENKMRQTKNCNHKVLAIVQCMYLSRAGSVLCFGQKVPTSFHVSMNSKLFTHKNEVGTF